MNVLITGASGSVGHYLIDYIRRVEPNAHVTGIGRRILNGRVGTDYLQCDLAEHKGLSFLAQLIVEKKPAVVFHLASDAVVKLSFDNPYSYLANNILCTSNLYEAIRAAKSTVTCILASTSEVYGAVPEFENPIIESRPFAPINPYAISKCTQEHLARFYWRTYGIKTVITRAFGYVNPLRKDLVATAIARQLVEIEREGGGQVRHGNTTPVRTFCDVRDVAEAYWLAATMCEPGEAYNVGSEDPVSVGDLIQCLTSEALRTAATPFEIEFIMDESLTRPADVTRCVPDCSKFRTVTGWEPKIPLRESLGWLIECARNEDHKNNK